MSRFKLFNGKIVTPYRIIHNGCVLVENGLIKAVEETDVKVEGFKEIDAKGNYISPGFIDIHTHGGGGHDFLDCTKTAYLGAAELHAAHGTTSKPPARLMKSSDAVPHRSCRVHSGLPVT